ncbi:hypothetical protein IAQ61_010811 [Plenodomus lingam]|uniref:uncharacterized protein n=1 Tax=Leptosphaeria maculans TaxID=5022 RepID=UPI003322D258|nr:hypothetical protein IAQ61_010811 [Plenodomus lingam]
MDVPGEPSNETSNFLQCMATVSVHSAVSGWGPIALNYDHDFPRGIIVCKNTEYSADRPEPVGERLTPHVVCVSSLEAVGFRVISSNYGVVQQGRTVY